MDYPWTYTHKYPGKNNPWIVIKAGSKDELMLRIREMFADPGEDPNTVVPGASLDDLVDVINNPDAHPEYFQAGPVAQIDKGQESPVESDMPMVDDGSADQIMQWINEAPSEDALDKIWERYRSKLNSQHLSAMGARAEILKKGE